MTRKFNKLSDKDKLRYLLLSLSSAAMGYGIMKWRTDVYGIASQYYRMLRKTDYDIIKEKNSEQLIAVINGKKFGELGVGEGIKLSEVPIENLSTFIADIMQHYAY